MIPPMAEARQQGNSIDRFLIRAVIALAFLIIGVFAGFSLAVFYPKPQVATNQPTPECEPQPTSNVVEPQPQPQPIAEPQPEAEGTGEEGDGDGDGDAEETGEPEPEAEPDPEAIPISGNLIVEIREVSGESRSKGAIRKVAKRGGHQMETCINQHGPKLDVVRVHHELFIAPSGEVAGKLLLSGANPELDACVSEAVAGWNFGATSEPSFCKLKLVWMRPGHASPSGDSGDPSEPPVGEPSGESGETGSP